MIAKIFIVLLVLIVIGVLYSRHPYRIINSEKSDGYYFDFLKREVHYVPMGNWFELGNWTLDDIDIKTVEVLGKNYLKDKASVYFQYQKIANADASSFELLCADKGFYSKDKNRVYYKSHTFTDIDVASFKFAGRNCSPIVMDKNHVYFIYPVERSLDGNLAISPIENANPDKYIFLNDQYGKDDLAVYCNGILILGSDTETFALMGNEYYAKDKNAVYYNGMKVEGIDPITFTFIEGGGYSKDKNGIYFGLNSDYDEKGNPIKFSPRLVEGADPETFVMVQGEKVDYAKDKSRHYWGGRPE